MTSAESTCFMGKVASVSRISNLKGSTVYGRPNPRATSESESRQTRSDFRIPGRWIENDAEVADYSVRPRWAMIAETQIGTQRSQRTLSGIAEQKMAVAACLNHWMNAD